jgi:hypothetical protein
LLPVSLSPPILKNFGKLYYGVCPFSESELAWFLSGGERCRTPPIKKNLKENRGEIMDDFDLKQQDIRSERRAEQLEAVSKYLPPLFYDVLLIADKTGMTGTEKELKAICSMKWEDIAETADLWLCRDGKTAIFLDFDCQQILNRYRDVAGYVFGRPATSEKRLGTLRRPRTREVIRALKAAVDMALNAGELAIWTPYPFERVEVEKTYTIGGYEFEAWFDGRFIVIEGEPARLSLPRWTPERKYPAIVQRAIQEYRKTGKRVVDIIAQKEVRFAPSSNI